MILLIEPPICPACLAGNHRRCDRLCECPSWAHRTDVEPDYNGDDTELERRLERYERQVYGEIGDLP